MFGQQDEDEEFRRMLGGILGSGPAPYDVTTSMEQPEQMQLNAPYMPQSAPSIGGYTPPPAAAPPQYLDHVQGHQFGAGDIAMLAGIVAALGLGGKHRGEIAGSLAGQYGGAVMQANARADQRNQQVDQFNAQLAAKDDPLARWYRAGSLQARDRELKLQEDRENRIGAAQDAEAAKDPVEEARRIAQARADVALDTKRRGDDMDAGLKERLAEILGVKNGRLGAPGANGPTAPVTDPTKLLKNKLAQNALDGMADGTYGPDGKPKEKPKTPAQLAAETKAGQLTTPFPGMKVDDAEAWSAANMTPTERAKNLKYFRGVQQVKNSLQRMIELREANGTEVLGKGKSAYDSELTAAIGGFTEIGQSGVLNGGEFARYKDFIPGTGLGPSDLLRLPVVNRLVDGKDPTVEQLRGVLDTVNALAGDGLRSIGASFDEGVKPTGSKAAERDMGTSPSGGIKFSADPEAEAKFNSGNTGKPGGTRTVTVTNVNGKSVTQELTEEAIEELKRDKRIRSVQ